MLHDPGSYTPQADFDELLLSVDEKDVLRRLGTELAAIAALPVHAETAKLWRRLNDLDSVRPMVWINEIPWHEMNVDDELTLRTIHPWARELETRMRRTIYQWKHMRGDMVVSDYLDCPLAIHSTDFGIHEDVDIARTDAGNEIISRHFHIQISSIEDIEKIKMPKVTHNERMTELAFTTMKDLFKDIIPVKKVGQTHIWFTPWDYLIRWTGVQEAMIALYEQPDMVNAAVERMVDAWMVELDQFVDQNLLSLDNDNTRIGSGGYGYISTLPGNNFDPEYVKPHNMWGCSNAQIFSEVSPEMHWEFAMRHDFRWLERWGHTYYGCCEPLQNKVHLLRKIPNLRKVSVSPWNDLNKILPALAGDYAASVKPSPAIFVDDGFCPDMVKDTIRKAITAGGDSSHIEFIMKDISTVRYKPQNLWTWSETAMDVVRRAEKK
jgi:Fe-S-cluster formation regulator IscX/YfhJ